MALWREVAGYEGLYAVSDEGEVISLPRVLSNANANSRAILDFLTQDKITTLQAENQSLKLAASQANQNSYLTATLDAQTNELIRRINPMPVPAYQVPNPYAGCGCNPCGCGC